MIIKVLAENTASDPAYSSEHGLCLFVETSEHKLLFDTGASGLFMQNASKMQVDLAQIDLAVISHGHYDHGGGLPAFLEVNQTAKVYLQEHAFEKHLARRPGGRMDDIGLAAFLWPNDRFILCGENHRIDNTLSLFSGVTGTTVLPTGNTSLLKETDGMIIGDDFIHEQNLVVTENGKYLLIAGCAHRGIINILARFRQEKGRFPDYVVGGFHLYNHSTTESEDPALVSEIAMFLLQTNAQFFTCHCTGLPSFELLQSLMGDKIAYLSTGHTISLI